MSEVTINLQRKSNLVVCKTHQDLEKYFKIYYDSLKPAIFNYRVNDFIELFTGNVYQFTIAEGNCHGFRVDHIYFQHDIDYEIKNTIFKPMLKKEGTYSLLYDQ